MFCKFLRSRFLAVLGRAVFGPFWGLLCGEDRKGLFEYVVKSRRTSCLDGHGVGGVKWERMREMHPLGS